jgi:proline iminopeptidase
LGDGVTVSGFVKVSGGRLRYLAQGSGMPAMVIGSAVYYPRTFSGRLRKSLRLAFVDMRHFADRDDSLAIDRITLDTYLDDIERLSDHLGVERAVFMGHSHHGNLALAYASRHPDRVSHLVLIGTPPLAVADVLQAAAQYWEEHATPGRKAWLHRNLAALDAAADSHVTSASAFVARYVAEGPRYWHDPTFDSSWLWQDVPIQMDVVRVFRQFLLEAMMPGGTWPSWTCRSYWSWAGTTTLFPLVSGSAWRRGRGP